MECLTAPKLPTALRIELERRPRAARRLGLVPPTPKTPTPSPNALDENKLEEEQLLNKANLAEAARRPRAAKRCGFIAVHIADEPNPTLEESVNLVDTPTHAMEASRRPRAALRLGFRGPAPWTTVLAVKKFIRAASRPLSATEAYQQEVQRQPRKAKRLGLLELNNNIVAVDAPASPYCLTPTAQMEADRRPRAVLRLHGRDATKESIEVPTTPLQETAFYLTEASRRPRCMARLQKSTSTPCTTGWTSPEDEGSEELEESLDLAENTEVLRLLKLAKQAAEQATAEAEADECVDPMKALAAKLEQQLANSTVPIGRVGSLSSLPRIGSIENSMDQQGPPSRGGSGRGGNLWSTTTAGKASSRSGSRGGSLRGGNIFWVATTLAGTGTGTGTPGACGTTSGGLAAPASRNKSYAEAIRAEFELEEALANNNDSGGVTCRVEPGGLVVCTIGGGIEAGAAAAQKVDMAPLQQVLSCSKGADGSITCCAGGGGGPEDSEACFTLD